MWSLGVIAYILYAAISSADAHFVRLCGFPPFVSCQDFSERLGQMPYFAFINESSDFLRGAIMNGIYTFPSPFWDDISPLAKSFVSDLLQVDMEERMTARAALDHPWITVSIFLSKPHQKLGARLAKHRDKMLYA